MTGCSQLRGMRGDCDPDSISTSYLMTGLLLMLTLGALSMTPVSGQRVSLVD